MLLQRERARCARSTSDINALSELLDTIGKRLEAAAETLQHQAKPEGSSDAA